MNNKQSVFRRKIFLFLNTILLLSISFLGASVRFETKIHKLVQDSVEIIVSQEVAELMKSSGYEMISGALYIRGKTLQFHYGKLSNGKKPDTNTLFEIGSITKTYTGYYCLRQFMIRKLIWMKISEFILKVRILI